MTAPPETPTTLIHHREFAAYAERLFVPLVRTITTHPATASAAASSISLAMAARA
jgi:hypothetical protein